MRKYRLSCRRISCPTCPMVTVTPLKNDYCLMRPLLSVLIVSHHSSSITFKDLSVTRYRLKLRDISSRYGLYCSWFVS